MKNIFAISAIFFLIFSCKQEEKMAIVNEKTLNKYEPNWESLAKHTADPEWFHDSKLGIYFHWGIYSVPAYRSEWYPYRLYQVDKFPEYKEYHEKNYGKIEEFGYHDFIPMFKAEKFDAENWATLFKTAGAKFAGLVAQHHDGFAMWDSEINPWNSADMGPKKDITGEILTALKKRGLKTITSFHHARLRQRHDGDSTKWNTYNSHFAYHPDYPTSTEDATLKKFYGNMPQKEFDLYWLDQIKEVVDKYSPDMLWYDVWLNHIAEDKIQEMSAHFLNNGLKTGQEPVLIAKHSDLPKNMSVLDLEQGGKKDVSESVWMTDITVSDKGSWCYTNGQIYKSPELLLRNMIDVWSKNGVVLLNISPMADGTINKEQRNLLKDVGGWLNIYGEAVYGTRPFYNHGFGHAKAGDSEHDGQSAKVKYTVDDVRYTVSKDKKAIYIFLLGKPKAGDVITLKSFSDIKYGPYSPVKRIVELKSGEEVKWEKTERNHMFTIPENVKLSELANVFKMELE